MAKGQYLSAHQQKIVNSYYENRDTIFVTKLATIVSDLYICKSEKELGRLWAKAKEYLAKTGANPARASKLLAEKNVEELARLVGELTTGKPQPATTGATPGESSASASPALPATDSPAAAAPELSPETLKSAMTAFKKRLKLTRLNEESRLSPRPMTGGKKSQVVGIIPPDQFPKEVWDELCRQNKLKSTGRGFYELIEGP